MTGETAGDAAEALRGRRDRRVGAGGARRRCGAARRAGARRGRSGRRPRAAGSSSRSISMPCRGRRRGRRRRPATPDAGPSTTGRDRPSSRARTTCRRRSPPPSPTRRGSRSTPATGSPRSNRGSPPSRRSGSGSCSTTRGRAAAPRWRSPIAGTDGRTVAVEGPDDAATLRRLLDRLAIPVVAPRGQAAARRPDRRRPRRADPTPGRLRHPDRGVRPQRLAAQPDHRRRRRRAARPDPAAASPSSTTSARAGLEALSAIAVREPLERRLVDDGLDRLYREIELPLDRGPGPDGGDRRRPRPRGARGPRDRVRRPRSRGSRRRSTPTSATSSTSAAPSSSSRSCSSSSTCRRASGPRPATRPTPRCSRTCGRPTR